LETVARLQRFVREIGLEPIQMAAEYPGYLFNSLLQLLLMQSLELVERGVSSAEEVDRSWRAVTHMPVGPFGMMQQIGLTTLREIVGRAAELIRDERSRRAHALLTGPRAEGLWAHLPEERGDVFAVYRQEWQQTECETLSTEKEQQREHAGHWCVLASRSFGEANDARLRLLTDALDSWEVVDRKVASWLGEGEPSDAFESILRSSRLVIVLDGEVAGEPWQELAGWIRLMRHWLGDAQQGKRVCVVIDWQRLAGIAPRGWGHAGLWRALWMEGLAIAKESAGERGNHLDVVVMEGNLREASVWSSVGHWCRRERVPSNDLSAAGKVVTNDAVTDLSTERKIFERLQRRITFEADSGERVLVPRLVLESTLPPVDEVFDIHLRGTTWIVTGGGRGITARMALALARHGAKLEILGRTEFSDQRFACWPGKRETNEARVMRRQEAIRTGVRSGLSAEVTARRFDAEEELLRTWSELTELGADFRYHPCDVADRAALACVMDEVRGRRGEVSGILHGAGSEWTARLAKKDDAAIEQTVRAKIQGSVELARWIGRRTRWFVTCSSLAGFWGGVGQVDYAAANRFLMDQAEELSKLHQHVRVLSIAWPGWQGVGMAARPASRWALQRAGMRLIDIDEGVRHFLRLLVTPGSPVVQVVCREDLPAELFGELGNA
jgi:NAD(P)-dependent dehydrogenase (short-subunit alcohol dehydrogenase family)